MKPKQIKLTAIWYIQEANIKTTESSNNNTPNLIIYFPIEKKLSFYL